MIHYSLTIPPWCLMHTSELIYYSPRQVRKSSTFSLPVSYTHLNGFVTLDEHGNLILTGSGLSIALKIYERHLVISQFLISIGVAEEIAKKDACRMEHVISDESFEKIKQLSHKTITE